MLYFYHTPNQFHFSECAKYNYYQCKGENDTCSIFYDIPNKNQDIESLNKLIYAIQICSWIEYCVTIFNLVSQTVGFVNVYLFYVKQYIAAYRYRKDFLEDKLNHNFGKARKNHVKSR